MVKACDCCIKYFFRPQLSSVHDMLSDKAAASFLVVNNKLIFTDVKLVLFLNLRKLAGKFPLLCLAFSPCRNSVPAMHYSLLKLEHAKYSWRSQDPEILQNLAPSPMPAKKRLPQHNFTMFCQTKAICFRMESGSKAECCNICTFRLHHRNRASTAITFEQICLCLCLFCQSHSALCYFAGWLSG